MEKKHPSEKPRTRDPEATQRRILKAATKEFADKGLSGARIDEVAKQSKSNKRMIYHYFSNKEGLFTRVIEETYLGIRRAEQALELGRLDPEEAIETLIRFTWNYYLENPEFLTLINSENLHHAKHLKASPVIREVHTNLIEVVRSILERGVKKGVFRSGVDPVQLNITIAAVGYYYLTNRFTSSIIFDRDLMTSEALKERLNFNIETILKSLRP